MTVSMPRCKQRLALAWFLGAGVIFFVVYIQTIFGRYGDKTTDVWSWLLPTIFPTLSLAIGVLVMDSLGAGVKILKANQFLYRLTLGISCAYLASVLLLFLLQPFTAVPAVQLMQQSNLWLGPFQGLVAAGMGAFFSTVPNEPAPGAAANGEAQS